MGDVSAEPSMEEILSSIKRIIAEEGDGAMAAARARRPARPIPRGAPEPFDREEILELSDRLEPDGDDDAHEEPPMPRSRAFAQPAEPILSRETTEATRGPLDALSRMVVKPETAGADTLEGLVRELLRPMLREWLDANLPALVEEMVSREIARITGQR